MRCYRLHSIKFLACPSSYQESSSRPSVFEDLTLLGTPGHSNCTITSSGSRAKGCRSRKSTFYHTVRMASKDQRSESWQPSFVLPFTMYSVSSTITHQSAQSARVRKTADRHHRADGLRRQVIGHACRLGDLHAAVEMLERRDVGQGAQDYAIRYRR
jgi:hypothetical protein